MAKIIKPLLMVASIAVNFIPGIGQVLSVGLRLAITLAGVAAAMSSASGAFSKKPAVTKETTDRLQANIDPRTPRKMIFGETAMSTDIRDQEFTGSKQEYLHRFIVVASHKVTSIDRIWFDDKLAWTATGGAQGDFAGYLTITPILEGSPANAINISTRMGNTRRYTGCAYLHIQYKLTGNSSKADSPFSQSVPTRMTIIGKACPVYDPRFDSTVPGGSGSMRADDQSTWAFEYGGVECGTNPACQLLTWLLGWRIQNPSTGALKLAVGKGIPPERIDLQSFITGANLCDEPVTLAAGGTERRYRSGAALDENENPYDVVEAFKGVMNALFDDADGQLRLSVLHNDLTDPAIPVFTDIDVLGAFQWNPAAPLDKDYNVVRGSFTDPSDTALYQLNPYPDVTLDSVDDIERSDKVDFGFCESPSQAQRLAKARLQRAQYPGTFSADFDVTAWKVLKGDILKFSFKALAFNLKLFRVMETAAQTDGRVPMVLREEHASIYQWDSDERPAVVGAEPTVYQWQNSPLLQGLADVTNSILVEWSPDGLTSWGTYTAGDRWMRVSTDGGATWSAPALAIGEDGFGTRHVFKRSTSAPATPTGDGVPSGWSDGPPSGTNPLWLSTTIQDIAGVTQTGWSIPVRLDGPAGTDGTNGTNGVSPIAVSAQPESFVVQVNADGTFPSGQFPYPIAHTAIQAGSTVTITGIDGITATGCAATASGSDLSVNTISALSGSVSYDVHAASQTVHKTVTFTTARAGGSGAVSQTIGVDAAATPLTWGSYQQHGGTLAINASSSGKLSVNLTGALKADLGGDMQFYSKVSYSTNNGSSWSDLAGSEHLSTLSEETFEPHRQSNANVSGSGPYSMTGLGADTAVLLRIMDYRIGDNATSGALVLYAEQVA